MKAPCPYCGADITAMMKFCSQCGNSLLIVCKKCQADNHSLHKFCSQCGNTLSQLQSTQQPVVKTDNLLSAEAFDKADRRQVTVFFSDLKDSVKLSRTLDAEDFRELLRSYRETCDSVVKRFGGTYPRYIGDGIRVYFGYPRAHEDDPERAVRAGLELIEKIKLLNNDSRWRGRAEIAIRVGIATGQVIAGDLSIDTRSEEPEAVGLTPNLASRVHHLAEPNSLAIADDTKRLLGKLFDYLDLGRHELKGFSAPVRAWQVLQALPVKSRFEATRSPDTPFIGREEELDMLLRRWERTRQGNGQVVLLAGEAGIGKSRITRVLHRQLIDTGEFHRLHYQCSPYHNNSALYPIVDQLERDAKILPRDSGPEKLEKLTTLLLPTANNTDDIVPLLAALLSIPTTDHYPPLNISSQRQKEKTFAALVGQMRSLAARRPLLVVFEDAHWIDPTTLELLDLGVKETRNARVMIVMTFRPEFSAPWQGQSHVSYLLINRLNTLQTATMAEKIAGNKALPAEVIKQIVAKTEGVPLFVEELTKTLLDSKLLIETADQFTLNGPLPPLAIPATLQDSLMARLDQLSPAKAVAQIGAVIGREFHYDLLTAIAPLTEQRLQETLEQLLDAEVLYRPGTTAQTTYTFRHALLQEAAYDSLLRTRRQELHAQIAAVLEQRFPELWQGQPEVLAQHFSKAGKAEKAARYWFQAGKLASERSANREAVSHFRKNLEVLEALPETDERKQHELEILIAIGPALITTKGAATQEVGQIYARALVLCSELPESSQHFAALWGWSRISSNYPTKRDRAERMLALAERLDDQGLLLQAHHSLWASLFHLGQHEICCQHIEKGLALYETETGDYRWHASIYGGHDARVCGEGEAAQSLWLCGYPDQALQRLHNALSWAEELGHSGSLIHAMDMALLLYHYRQEVAAVYRQVARLIEFAENRGFPEHRAKGLVFHGWALTRSGELERGIELMRQGLASQNAIGTREDFAVFSKMLAEAYGKAGMAEKGLHQLAEAMSDGQHSGLQFWEAELHRCSGELLLMTEQADEDKAQESFQQALSVARRQQAKALELRASVSLARLLQRQGQRTQALELLAPVYDWFSEGYDTVDLVLAKTLLGELS